MFRSFWKPRMVLICTIPASKSHHTTDVCGPPPGIIVESAATGGHSIRSTCDTGMGAANRASTPADGPAGRVDRIEDSLMDSPIGETADIQGDHSSRYHDDGHDLESVDRFPEIDHADQRNSDDPQTSARGAGETQIESVRPEALPTQRRRLSGCPPASSRADHRRHSYAASRTIVIGPLLTA